MWHRSGFKVKVGVFGDCVVGLKLGWFWELGEDEVVLGHGG